MKTKSKDRLLNILLIANIIIIIILLLLVYLGVNKVRILDKYYYFNFKNLILYIEKATDKRETHGINIEPDEELEKYSKLFKPYIIRGMIDSEQGKKYVDIIEDTGNGSEYLITDGDNSWWIDGKDIVVLGSLDRANGYIPQNVSKEDKEGYINSLGLDSLTQYLVWTDLSRQETNIFIMTHDKWSLIKSMKSSGGLDRTPTKRGVFIVQDRGKEFKEPSNVNRVYKYWIRYDGSYLYHSLPMSLISTGKDANNSSIGNGGDSNGISSGSSYTTNGSNGNNNNNGEINKDKLGKEGSTNGCIANSVEDAKWLYDNIGQGTTVYIN